MLTRDEIATCTGLIYAQLSQVRQIYGRKRPLTEIAEQYELFSRKLGRMAATAPG